ncbi:hypothetical protein PhiBTCVTUL1a_23 [Burkholderia phage phiBtTUL1a]|nr:hypothetical protein PhiBTCVTUL1a_23 [Burkholderia phage phiBtTUL1a]
MKTDMEADRSALHPHRFIEFGLLNHEGKRGSRS